MPSIYDIYHEKDVENIMQDRLIVEQTEEKLNGPFWSTKMHFAHLACSWDVLGNYVCLNLTDVTTRSTASISRLEMNPKKRDRTPEADEDRTMSKILSGNWFN